PPRIFIRVDLPAPFSPTTASTSPRPSRKLTSCSACTPGNALQMPRASSRKSATTDPPNCFTRRHLLARQLLKLRLERIDSLDLLILVLRASLAVLVDDSVSDIDLLLGVNIGPVERLGVGLDDAGHYFDGLIAEVVWVLHDGARN